MAILTKTGAVRNGHFILPSGRHTDHTVQMPLAMRYYREAKMLCVALGRKLRCDPEIARHLPNVSIVCPATGGIPVAFGLAEALQASQVYWAERLEGHRVEFRQFMETHENEQCIVVDDILRTGAMLAQLRDLLLSRGAKVLALAVIVHQPNIETVDFGYPVYSLAKLDANYWEDEKSCPLCKQGVPAVRTKL